MIKWILILLYLLVGYLLFMSAVKTMGGREYCYSGVFEFVVRLILVILLWPYFLFRGITRRR